MRSKKDYLILSGKGMMMGAADAVPGVSGGTIAFITGIYEELIDSIKRFNPEAVRILFREGVGSCWRYVNGNFLLALVAGILLSLLTISRVVLYLLDEHPILLWSFFFGLILASTWSVVRHIRGWNFNLMAAFASGVLFAYMITVQSPGNLEPTLPAVFMAGMIAICAMILPGISGSFILLLMGLYAPILEAVKGLEWAILLVFMVGCAAGLLSFSRILSWAFHHHRMLTLALLGGFMLGSLNKVWPWKYTLSYTINSKGEEVPVLQQNLLPDSYHQLTGLNDWFWPALALMLAGALLGILLDRQKT
jgi:putative membrane protein